MSAPVFVTLTALADGASLRINSQDNIAGLSSVPASQLPSGVAAGTFIEFDDRTIAVRGTIAATMALLGAAELGPVNLPNFPLGAVAYGSLGTDAVSVAGSLYIAEGFNPTTRTVTNLQMLNGTVVGTDLVIHFIYDGLGNLLGTSALAGTLSAGADGFQSFAIAGGPITLPAGRYFVGFQVNGTTARHRTMAANTYPNVGKSQVGVFGTIPATITVPNGFIAGVAPFALLT